MWFLTSRFSLFVTGKSQTAKCFGKLPARTLTRSLTRQKGHVTIVQNNFDAILEYEFLFRKIKMQRPLSEIFHARNGTNLYYY